MRAEQFLKNLSVPDRKVDVVLDTDAFNEADDQFQRFKGVFDSIGRGGKLACC